MLQQSGRWGSIPTLSRPCCEALHKRCHTLVLMIPSFINCFDEQSHIRAKYSCYYGDCGIRACGDNAQGRIAPRLFFPSCVGCATLTGVKTCFCSARWVDMTHQKQAGQMFLVTKCQLLFRTGPHFKGTLNAHRGIVTWVVQTDALERSRVKFTNIPKWFRILNLICNVV